MDRVAQPIFPSFYANQFDVGPDQILTSRDELQGRNAGVLHCVCECGRSKEDIVNGESLGLFILVLTPEAESPSRVRLGIAINQEDSEAFQCQRRAEVDGRGGLADPALLIDDSENFREFGDREGRVRVGERSCG